MLSACGKAAAHAVFRFFYIRTRACTGRNHYPAQFAFVSFAVVFASIHRAIDFLIAHFFIPPCIDLKIIICI
jgi:hypothetical protein